MENKSNVFCWLSILYRMFHGFEKALRGRDGLVLGLKSIFGIDPVVPKKSFFHFKSCPEKWPENNHLATFANGQSNP